MAVQRRSARRQAASCAGVETTTVGGAAAAGEGAGHDMTKGGVGERLSSLQWLLVLQIQRLDGSI